LYIFTSLYHPIHMITWAINYKTREILYKHTVTLPKIFCRCAWSRISDPTPYSLYKLTILSTVTPYLLYSPNLASYCTYIRGYTILIIYILLQARNYRVLYLHLLYIWHNFDIFCADIFTNNKNLLYQPNLYTFLWTTSTYLSKENILRLVAVSKITILRIAT
jgi:hypothetical protein